MDALLEWRQEFLGLDDKVHLISHSLGAVPVRSRDRLLEYASDWADRGVRAWEEKWWDLPIAVGDLIGNIIGAGPDEVAMHQNVSIAQAVIFSCFNWSERRNGIVTDDLNFTTNLYLCEAMRRAGAAVTVVNSEDGATIDLERFLHAIDDRTRLVLVSHIIFRSGFVQDLRAITRRAHEMGAMIVADLYQSAGVVPVNVGELGVDFATGGSVKWLCGGPGAGYLYVRRDLIDVLEPALTGWAAHSEPFSFETGPIRYAAGSRRFLNGTPNIPGLFAARSGCEIVGEIGVVPIRQKSIRQTSLLISLAENAGLVVRTPRSPEQRGGMVVIDVPRGAEVTAELLSRNFLCDYRPGAGIRISPHFYTKDEEIELIIREIGKILSGG